VQSVAGGAACVIAVCNDGEVVKSNMSSAGFASLSRLVMLAGVPEESKNRLSISARMEV
jgi:hypothetical protein